MTWTMKKYPEAFSSFTKETRKKAVDIANAIVEDGKDAGMAIATAAKQAKQWAEENINPVEVFHLVPSDNKWLLKKENNNSPEKEFDTKEKALVYMKDKAKSGRKKYIVHKKDGTIEKHI